MRHVLRAMALSVTAATVVISLSLSTTGAQALTLAQAAQPKELPPAGYTGNTYVDSRGCAYVRAGLGGTVNWVPRVGSNRKVICGLAPTFSHQATTPVVVPPAPTPVAPTVPTTTTTAAATTPGALTATPSPAPAPTVFRSTQTIAPAPKPAVTKPRVAVTTSSPSPTPAPTVFSATRSDVDAPVAVSPARATPRVATGSTAQVQTQTIHAACNPNGGPTLVNLGGGKRARITCGSQEQIVRIIEQSNGMRTRLVLTQSPATWVAQQGTRGAAQAAPTAARVTSSATVPEGYRAAWDDDRLNPNRGPRTAQGTAQMDLIWTRTVPRQLVDKNTGRVVNRLFPDLQYPHTSMAAQQAAVLSTKSAARKPATKPAATRASVSVGASHRFVQAASFGNPANAQRTAQRLASLGLPVRMGSITRGGKALKVVLAGPFSRQAELQAALTKVRRAGFSDAFFVK
ncbi:SPOR domain-containing protein [Aliiroseovarius subalbicans]|uniref:SPOR domain-containing protein n=1 Tax=Aliiroseovarius subalbicans TaxID=2925840 RepID=UPI001F564ADE|nr:SPOR domain-containing protein [Aliiroseovarius subalbicans]MCI2399187.1 SPOR domain-containing protein [Aliiroseovarius subalbicans]